MAPNSVRSINLLLIDGDSLFREGLRKVLERDMEFRVLAEGDTEEQLKFLYKEYLPHVVIMDVDFQRKSGIEALENLTAEHPHSKVLLFTSTVDSYFVSLALKNGASGYMLKKMDVSSIGDAIKTVFRGGVYLHPELTGDFISEFRQLKKRESDGKFYQKAVMRPYHLLTRRETEVLQLLAEGYSNNNLSKVLKISEKTVKGHVSAILRKMELHDRTQAVVTALKNGWVELK